MLMHEIESEEWLGIHKILKIGKEAELVSQEYTSICERSMEAITHNLSRVERVARELRGLWRWISMQSLGAVHRPGISSPWRGTRHYRRQVLNRSRGDGIQTLGPQVVVQAFGSVADGRVGIAAEGRERVTNRLPLGIPQPTPHFPSRAHSNII